jgi:leader peptidase (prepilin peptidase)/N-methyltransferase
MIWPAFLLFGLIVGSFLNVCIYRLPRYLSVARPRRSYCPYCNSQITWYDNIPVLSFLLLGGRCRNCGGRISARYPAVEVLTGVLFAIAGYSYGLSLVSIKACLAAALLIGLLFSDLENFILPEEFTWGGLAAGLILACFLPLNDGTAAALLWLLGLDVQGAAASVADAALGAAAPAGLLWIGGALYEKIRGREGLGFGDVMMVAMMGSLFGLRGNLMALIIGSVLGSITGLTYLWATGKDPATTHLPFGTFLAIGGLVVLFAGGWLSGWHP